MVRNWKRKEHGYTKSNQKEKGKERTAVQGVDGATFYKGRECLAAYHGSWVLMSLPCGPTLAAASAETNRTAVQVPGKRKERKGKKTSEKRKGTCFVASAFGAAPPMRFSFFMFLSLFFSRFLFLLLSFPWDLHCCPLGPGPSSGKILGPEKSQNLAKTSCFFPKFNLKI